MQNKTNKRDFAIFKEEFLLWVNEFGVLKGWEFEFEYVPINDSCPNKALADVRCYTDDRLVDVSFYENWFLSTVNNYSIRKTAFHEALEVLFEPVEHLVKPQCKKQARIEVHTVIKVMENTLFNDSYIKRFGKIDDVYYNTGISINTKPKRPKSGAIRKR